MTTPLEQTQVVARPRQGMLAVAISGSPRAPSKSKVLGELMLAELEQLGCATRLIDVAEMSADALAARSHAPDVDEAIDAVGEARIVIAASPTYRALYTGVLKCFFDLMPQAHLAGKVCLGIQTGIAAQHALSPEYGLRPLFASLEGVSLASIYATDAEFANGEPSADLVERLRAAAHAAIAVARQGPI
ncbi:MAG: NAD(P)H-dependent oxidoreductase [Dehalococcoidia bacterium]